MKIVFPELNNQIAKTATERFQDIEFISTNNLEEATELLIRHEADTLISGLDYSSRDVLVACRDHLQLSSRFFSSCFICKNGEKQQGKPRRIREHPRRSEGAAPSRHPRHPADAED